MIFLLRLRDSTFLCVSFGRERKQQFKVFYLFENVAALITPVLSQVMKCMVIRFVENVCSAKKMQYHKHMHVALLE